MKTLDDLGRMLYDRLYSNPTYWTHIPWDELGMDRKSGFIDYAVVTLRAVGDDLACLVSLGRSVGGCEEADEVSALLREARAWKLPDPE